MTMSPARARSHDTITTLRSSRSARTPPTGAAKMGGTSRSTSTTATAVWLRVSSKARAMNASVATQSPIPETAWPSNRRRNPRAWNSARAPVWLPSAIPVGILRGYRHIPDGSVSERGQGAVVAVVTDSAANVPPELADELGIRVAPLELRFGDRAFRDGIEMAGADFYDRLETEPDAPSTAAPSPGDYLEAYRGTGDREVVCVTIGSGLSVANRQASR